MRSASRPESISAGGRAVVAAVPWIGRGARRSEAGFTLLEVITAIFIFFCGIVGILSLFTTALVLHKSSQDRTVTAMAMEQVVSVIGTLLDERATGGDERMSLPVLKEVPIEGRPGYSFSVEFEEDPETSAGDGVILARIRICWRARGREMGESFEYTYRPGAGLRRDVLRLRSEKERTL